MIQRFFFILILISSCVGCGSKKVELLPPGQKAPLARFQYAEGGYDSLASYQGKEVVMFFWAKWCPRSRRAIERFNDMAVAAQVAKPNTAFLAINMDNSDQEREVMEFRKKRNLMAGRHTFSGNGSADEAALVFKVDEIPVFFVIDAEGIIQLSSSDPAEVEDYLGIDELIRVDLIDSLGLIVPAPCETTSNG